MKKPFTDEQMSKLQDILEKQGGHRWTLEQDMHEKDEEYQILVLHCFHLDIEYLKEINEFIPNISIYGNYDGMLECHLYQ